MVMTVKQMVNAAALFIAPLHSAAGVESRGADTGPGQVLTYRLKIQIILSWIRIRFILLDYLIRVRVLLDDRILVRCFLDCRIRIRSTRIRTPGRKLNCAALVQNWLEKCIL